MNKTTLVGFAVMSLALAAPPAAGQDVLDRVRSLYAAAAYEDALTALSGLPDSTLKSDIEVYRVSCLVALGRTTEAQKAVDALVTAHPAYHPDPSEASPRIQELFKISRRQLLPGIARGIYADAKVALDRKERQDAVDGFSEVLRLLEDVDTTQGELVSELRLLASGFLELSRALPAAAAPPPAAPAAAAIPAPAEAGTPASASSAPPVLGDIPAQVINQTLPAWQPRESGGRPFEFQGAVKVSISAEGKVVSAVITDPVEYSYDRLLLRAAQSWTYRPARRAGVPVASEKTVEVTLKPK
jgi:hypothetical protein